MFVRFIGSGIGQGMEGHLSFQNQRALTFFLIFWQFWNDEKEEKVGYTFRGYDDKEDDNNQIRQS